GRRSHADPAPADMPICARTIMAAGERDAFNVACVPGAVFARRAAENCQSFDMNVGASEYSEDGPLVFAVTRATRNSDKVCDLPHGCSVAVPRIQANLDPRVVRGVNRIVIGRSSWLA